MENACTFLFLNTSFVSLACINLEHVHYLVLFWVILVFYGWQGFDEYMNLVLEDAEEVNIKKKSRKSLGNSIS